MYTNANCSCWVWVLDVLGSDSQITHVGPRTELSWTHAHPGTLCFLSILLLFEVLLGGQPLKAAICCIVGICCAIALRGCSIKSSLQCQEQQPRAGCRLMMYALCPGLAGQQLAAPYDLLHRLPAAQDL